MKNLNKKKKLINFFFLREELNQLKLLVQEQMDIKNAAVNNDFKMDYENFPMESSNNSPSNNNKKKSNEANSFYNNSPQTFGQSNNINEVKKIILIILKNI